MRKVIDETGMLIDPHTAVGVAAAIREQERMGGPWWRSRPHIRRSSRRP